MILFCHMQRRRGALALSLVLLILGIGGVVTALQDPFDRLLLDSIIYGNTPVVVTLRVPADLESELARQQAIRGVQDDVLNALSHHNISNVKRFSSFPLLAMRASLLALLRLGSLPEVTSVTADSVRSGTFGESTVVAPDDKLE